jgi:peroxiredoxin
MHSIPDIGDPAPDVAFPSIQRWVRLSERLDRGCVLVVLYPRDDPLVCTRQLCNDCDDLSVIDELRVQIIAVNEDPLEAHR